MTAPSPTDPRFFTENWSITLPTHPHLRFVRLTPGNLSAWFAVASDPRNNTAITYPGQNPAWDDARKAAAAARFQARWAEHQSKHNGLDALVLSAAGGSTGGEEILGNGGCFQVMPGLANVGIELAVEARGKGAGKALMQVLLRLSCEVEVQSVHCGTMKENTAMRALARSLGLQEREEVVEMPGRGVVAELLYADIERQRWKGLEMNVEFLGPVS